MGFVRGLDSGAIPLARPTDLAMAAWGGEYETLGHVKDLLFGADLSSLEAIWDRMLERVDKTDTRREDAREWHDELSKLGKRLKP
jgi:hypothetical protein